MLVVPKTVLVEPNTPDIRIQNVIAVIILQPRHYFGKLKHYILAWQHITS